MLIHNKLLVLERLFRIEVKQDPYCLHCAGAEVADIEHFFSACVRTRQCWSWVRLNIMGLFHGSQIMFVGSQSVSLLESQAYGLIAGEPEQIHGRAEVDDEQCS